MTEPDYIESVFNDERIKRLRHESPQGAYERVAKERAKKRAISAPVEPYYSSSIPSVRLVG